MKLLWLLVLTVGLSSNLVLADQMLNFTGNGRLSDSKAGAEDYEVALQVLVDGRGIHYHWLYRGDRGEQRTRNCLYLKEGNGVVVEVFVPSKSQSCLSTPVNKYQSVGWGSRLRSRTGLESLISYRDSSGGRFTVLLQEDYANDRLRVTGHYLDGNSILQHWVDYLQLVD